MDGEEKDERFSQFPFLLYIARCQIYKGKHAFPVTSLASLFTSSSKAAPALSDDPDEGEWVQYSKRQTVPHFANRNYKTVRGVNLGGWFVLESW